MKIGHIKYLACPSCSEELVVTKIEKLEKDSIECGEIQCTNCNAAHNIVRHIPRFVPIENYASGFGFEWNRHAKTQYDSYTRTTISEERFFI